MAGHEMPMRGDARVCVTLGAAARLDEAPRVAIEGYLVRVVQALVEVT